MFEVLLAIYIVLSIAATAVIFRLDYLERRQAVMQSLLAWLIPFLGALFVLIFQAAIHKDMTTRAGPDKENPNSEDTNADALYHELDSSD